MKKLTGILVSTLVSVCANAASVCIVRVDLSTFTNSGDLLSTSCDGKMTVAGPSTDHDSSLSATLQGKLNNGYKLVSTVSSPGSNNSFAIVYTLVKE